MSFLEKFRIFSYRRNYFYNEIIFLGIRFKIYRKSLLFSMLEKTALKQEAANNKTIFFQHQILNNIHFEALRNKVRDGGKVKVIFLCSTISRFHVASVYKAMEERHYLFDPVVLCFADEYERPGSVSNFSEMREYFERLSDEKFNVLWGYDDSGYPKDFEEFKPDIIIHCTPYMHDYLSHHNPKRWYFHYLTCYIPYGMHVANTPGYHFDNALITPSWLHFMDTRQAFDICSQSSFTGGVNTILSGTPILDDYIKPVRQDPRLKLPGQPTVIYAPHWSIETWNNTSTFHLHYETIMKSLLENPNINFVFKPHLRLGPEIQKREGQSDAPRIKYEEYLNYRKKWDDAENGCIIEDSSFIELFKQSDCLITDSYSFITLWLPSGKPCIYLMNPEAPDPYQYYYDFIHPILDSYYICKTTEEIERTFRDVVLNGNDPKADARKKQSEAVIYNLGHAGEFIADYIEKKIKR